jgi:hypothetical protein
MITSRPRTTGRNRVRPRTTGRNRVRPRTTGRNGVGMGSEWGRNGVVIASESTSNRWFAAGRGVITQTPFAKTKISYWVNVVLVSPSYPPVSLYSPQSRGQHQ